VDGPQGGGAVAAVGVSVQGWHEAGATASLGHPEGSTDICSGAETAKKARTLTLTRMEACADEEIIQADTVVDDELEEAKAGFDRTAQETNENLKRQHEMEEQARTLVMDQMVKAEEAKRDVDERHRRNTKHGLCLEYEARFAALKQEYEAVEEANDQADEEARKKWLVHIDAVRDTHKKEKAESARTRLEQTHACNEQLKTRRDTELGMLKEQLETERDIAIATKGIRDGHSKKVRDAFEKHRESLEEDVKQRHAKEEKIWVQKDAESVTEMAATWVDIKAHVL